MSLRKVSCMLVVCYITLKIGKVSCMLSGLISRARRYADSCVYCDLSCDRYHIADGGDGVVADPTSPQSIHPEPREYFEGCWDSVQKTGHFELRIYRRPVQCVCGVP